MLGGLLGLSELANVVPCILTEPHASMAGDLDSFANVMVRLFLPLEPREELLQRHTTVAAFDFFCCVRGRNLEAAVEVLDILVHLLNAMAALTDSSIASSRTSNQQALPI